MIPSPIDMLPLSLLRAGQLARVAELIGDAEHCHRLEELGLRRGVLIEMIQPGSPCIIHLAGGKLCLRNGDSFGVLVAREEAA